MELAQAEREYNNDLPDFHEFDSSALRDYDPELDYTEYAFVQPDGSPLGVSYPGRDRKIVRFKTDKRYRDFHTFINPFRPGSKCHAKLELWKDKNKKQFVICIDIDKVLRRQYREANKVGAVLWDECPYDEWPVKLGYIQLAKDLQNQLGKRGYVFNSIKSGRPKILMVVEYETAVRTPSIEDLKALCVQYFPELVENECIDFNRGAFSSTFIPWEKRIEIRDILPTLEPIKITRSAESITFQTENERRVVASTFTYLVADKLPKELDTKRHGVSFKAFLKMLCTMSALVKRGFGISQKVVARTLGIRQTTASFYIRKAIAMGYLSVHNDSYEVGKRAKIYKAKGALRRFIKKKIVTVLPIDLPRRIRKGKWHSTLIYYAVKCFRMKPESFLKWVKSVKDHNVGDRWEQALNIYKWLQKAPIFKR